MVGRAGDKNKRFDLGIKAMKYIIKEIPDSELKIISKLSRIYYLKKLINDLNLKENIKFMDILLILKYISKMQVYISFQLSMNHLD